MTSYNAFRAAVFIIAFLLLLSFLAPWIMVQDLSSLNPIYLQNSLKLPLSWPYILGTDELGRDILSSLIFGVRLSLMICGGGTLLALVWGVFWGCFSAYHKGFMSQIIQKNIILSLSMPTVLIALILVGLFKGGVFLLALSIFLGQWGYFAKTARSIALREVNQGYVESAQLLGRSSFMIIVKHIIPNCLGPVLVLFPTQFAHALILEAGLPFLGVGFPITTPSLGMLLHKGFEYLLSQHLWVFLCPFLGLVLILVCLAIITDYLRIYFHPQLRNKLLV
jgi:peptide/nickel transport system permease protein